MIGEKVIELFKDSINEDTQIEIIALCPRGVIQDAFIKDLEGKYKWLFPNLKKNIKVYTSGFEGYLREGLFWYCLPMMNIL